MIVMTPLQQQQQQRLLHLPVILRQKEQTHPVTFLVINAFVGWWNAWYPTLSCRCLFVMVVVVRPPRHHPHPYPYPPHRPCCPPIIGIILLLGPTTGKVRFKVKHHS